MRTGGRFLVLYALAPEKFVASALLKAGGVDSHGLWVSREIVAAILGCVVQRCPSEGRAGQVCVLCCGCLLDLCGLGALGAGLAAANFPPSLAVRSLASFLPTVLHHDLACWMPVTRMIR